MFSIADSVLSKLFLPYIFSLIILGVKTEYGLRVVVVPLMIYSIAYYGTHIVVAYAYRRKYGKMRAYFSELEVDPLIFFPIVMAGIGVLVYFAAASWLGDFEGDTFLIW